MFMKKECLVLFFLGIALMVLCTSDSPTRKEKLELSSGLIHLRNGDFSVSRSTPPLPRLMSCTLVEILESPSVPSNMGKANFGERKEFIQCIAFDECNEGRTLRYIRIARLVPIACCMLAGWFCFSLTARIHGLLPAQLSLGAWCLSPLVLSYGHLAVPHIFTTLFILAAVCSIFSWIERPRFTFAALSGACTGAALLCSHSSLSILPVEGV